MEAGGLKHALTVVVGNDVETVQQLSLVFMDSLDLDVKHGVGIDLHLVVLLQMHSELQLVLLQDQNISQDKILFSICHHLAIVNRFTMQMQLEQLQETNNIQNANMGKMPTKTNKTSCHLSALTAGCQILGGLWAKGIFIIIAF